MRSSYLVCYDISDDKRLRKVFKLMRGFGDHLQFSDLRVSVHGFGPGSLPGGSARRHPSRRRSGSLRQPWTRRRARGSRHHCSWQAVHERG